MKRSPERQDLADHYSVMQALLPRVSMVLLFLVTVAVIGWAVCKSPPTPALPVCTDPDADRFCDNGVCGTNSPTVNGFPINGVRSNGQCNSDGVQLIPGSLSGGQGERCTGATLDLDGNELVGLNPDGTVRCRGAELKGASFEVRSWVDEGKSHKKSRRIVIQDIASYKPDHGETRTSYGMVADKPGTVDSLCASREAIEFRDRLGLRSPSPLDPSPSAGHDSVIPVSSELYDVFGRPVTPKHSRPAGRSWLHFACVHDALAKRSLYGLHTDSVEYSRAALKMLTANYCGGRPLTLRGVKIAWANGDPANLEASWSSQQATCVSKLRVLYRNGSELQQIPSDWPRELKSICGDKGKAECPNLEKWRESAARCHVGGETTTLGPCCSGSNCPRGDVESYIVLDASTP